MRDRFDIDQVIKITGLGIRADQADGGADFDVACQIAVKKLWKIKKYESLEEQGKLLNLPCVVGDILYRIEEDRSITDLKVFSINIFENGIQFTCKEMKKHGETCYYSPGFSIGKVVFYTKEEAEIALKELED